jgi:hypothetical protein
MALLKMPEFMDEQEPVARSTEKRGYSATLDREYGFPLMLCFVKDSFRIQTATSNN